MYFTNIAVIQNVGVLQQIWVQNHWGMLLMCQNTTMQVYGGWIKTYHVLCPKTYTAALETCHNRPLVRDKPPGAPACVKLVYSCTEMAWFSCDVTVMKNSTKHDQWFIGGMRWISTVVGLWWKLKCMKSNVWQTGQTDEGLVVSGWVSAPVQSDLAQNLYWVSSWDA